MSKVSLIVSLVLHSSFLLLFYVLDSNFEKANTNILDTEIIFQKDNQQSQNKSEIVKYNDDLSVDIKKKEISNDKIIAKTKVIKKNISFQKNKINDELIVKNINKSVSKVQTSANNLQNKKFNKSKETLDVYRKYNKSKESKKNFRAHYKTGSINNPHPPYPILARKKGWQGSLRLEVSVNKLGIVEEVEINKSSGYSILDNTSKKTIKEWKFRPAVKNGLITNDKLYIPIRFVLD